jgi:hypothetical protein
MVFSHATSDLLGALIGGHNDHLEREEKLSVRTAERSPALTRSGLPHLEKRVK